MIKPSLRGLSRPNRANPNFPEPFDVWDCSGWCGFNLVGESFRTSDIAAIVKAHGGNIRREGDLKLPVTLVREPSNKHDPNAVMALIDGRCVGYVPRELAPRYHAPLDQLGVMGRCARVPGYLRWYIPFNEKNPVFSIQLDLGNPSLLVPVNEVPPDARLLPSGKSLEVKELPEALDLLSSLTRLSTTNEVSSVAILTIEVTKTGKESTGLQINDVAVGTLTPASSAHFLPIIKWGQANGLRIAAPAVLKGNQLDVQVRLVAKKASELPAAWLNTPIPAPIRPSPQPSPTGPSPLPPAATPMQVTTTDSVHAVVSPAAPPLNRHGSCGGVDPTKGWCHASTEEVSD